MSLKKLIRAKLLLIVLALLFGTTVFTEFAKAQTYVSQITFPYNSSSTPNYYMTAESWALQNWNGTQTLFSRTNNQTWGQTGLGDINNTYNLEAGQQYRLAIRGMYYYSYGWWYFGGYPMTSRQWIDWNADGDFTDAGERMSTNYYYANSYNPLGTSPFVWHYFTVPAGTEGKTFRLRLAICYSSTYPPISGTGSASTYGDAWDLKLYVKPKSDGGITAVVEPPARFLTGNQNLTFRLRNFGATLTSVNINYTIDGGAPQTYFWTGNMVKDSTADITVGTYNFNEERNYTITAYTSLPNNEADNNTSNDQTTTVIMPAPDAGITSFTQPNGAFPKGNQVIAVNLHNFGSVTLTSARIVWRSGIGGQVYTYDWTGNLTSGGTEEVVLGTYNFDSYQIYNLDANTEVPDGATDKDQTNDRATYDCGPALAPNNYYIGNYSGSSNTFTSGTEASTYISLSGIIGNGTLYLIYPDLDIADPNYMDGPLTFSNYPTSGTNNLVIKSESGDPSLVTIEYVADASNPYLLNISGTSNVSIEGIEFQVHGPTGYGGIINLANCNGATIKNNIFTGVEGANLDNNFTSINLDNVYNAHIFDNTFQDGAIGINEQSYCPRKIMIHNNVLTDATWKFVQLYGIPDGNPCSENDVQIFDNQFIGADFNAQFGVVSTNGTEIMNNIFTGFVGGSGTDAAIYLSNTDPTNFTGQTTVDNNEIYSNLIDINGISATDIPNLDITNNVIAVDESPTSFFATNAIYLNNCGTTSPANVTDNQITYSNSADGNAITVVDGSVMILRNDIDLPTAQTNLGNAIAATSASGYIANNQIGALLGTGVNLNNTNLTLYYNSVATESANNPAILVNGGSNVIMRNIFQNQGVGFAISASSAMGNTLNQNNYWSEGPNMAQWASNNVYDILDWQTTTGQDLNSTQLQIVFNDFATFDLGLNSFYESMVFDDPISFADPDLELLVQGTDYNGKTRYSYFMGSENIIPEIHITHQPSDVMDCFGAKDHSLRVSAFVTKGVLARYEWFKDGVSLTNYYVNPGTDDWANKASLYLDSIAFNPEPGLHFEIEGTYRCLVRGSGAEPQYSNYVLVNVLGPAEITRQPESQRAALGGEVIFNVEAHIVSGDTVDNAYYQPEIQWYRGNINNPVKDDFAANGHFLGSKTNILSIRNITSDEIGDDYFVVFRGLCDSLYSENVSVQLFPTVTINEDPATQAICEGQKVTFTVTATASESEVVPKYQWRKDAIAINGATNNTYEIEAVTPADVASYDCIVSVFPGGDTKISAAAALTVKLGPSITVQPVGVPTGVEGQPFELNITATGNDPIEYQWYKNDVIIDGATSAIYSVAAASSTIDGGDYYCLVKNECNTVKSNVVTVTITPGGIVGVRDSENGGFILDDCTPNPVTNETTINFFAPEASAVRLAITDVYGKELAVVFEGTAKPNINIVKVNASELSSGVYYYTLTAGNYSITRKMVIIK